MTKHLIPDESPSFPLRSAWRKHNVKLGDIRVLSTTAAAWRSEHPQYSSGVVLIWQGEVYGWKNSLREAGHERPGVYAVDEDGCVFIAEGGNDREGAKCWVAVTSEN